MYYFDMSFVCGNAMLEEKDYTMFLRQQPPIKSNKLKPGKSENKTASPFFRKLDIEVIVIQC
jgi:hypothetical protein